MSTGEDYGQEGGVGGQPRTPTAPAAAGAVAGLREYAAERWGNRWISKVVDPASTLITKRATRMFSRAFRKGIGHSPPEESPGAKHREAAPVVYDPVSTSDKDNCPTLDGSLVSRAYNHSDGKDISELEQLLKQKTFTWAECEQLMFLLHSRTVQELEVDNKRSKLSSSLPADVCKKQDENLLPQENITGSYKFTGVTSAPCPTSKIFEDDIASPAELAKSYMSSKSSKVSPSSLCLRSQMLRETIASPSFIGFAPKSSPKYLKSSVPFANIHGTPEERYRTTKSQDRLSISEMPCSSYSKHQHIFTQKVLKRRNSILEDTAGPIQRIRQRSNLAFSTDVMLGISRKVLPKEISSVPLHSREMEEKILQLLDKLVPTPKVKSTEAETVCRDESPSILSSDEG